MLTEDEASEVMRHFLTEFWKRGGSDPGSGRRARAPVGSFAFACQEQPIVSAAPLRLAREATTRLAIVAAALLGFRDDTRQG